MLAKYEYGKPVNDVCDGLCLNCGYDDCIAENTSLVNTIKIFVCGWCGKEFEFETTKGRDRKYCSVYCRHKKNNFRFENKGGEMEHIKLTTELCPGDVLYQIYPSIGLCKLKSVNHGATGTVSYYFDGFVCDRPCMLKMFKNYGNRFFVHNDEVETI